MEWTVKGEEEGGSAIAARGAGPRFTADFHEESAAHRIESLSLAHLSIEVGHFYMEDFRGLADRLEEMFRALQPWVAAAGRSCAAERPRISTCFLVDDYFTPGTSPAEVLPAVLAAAQSAGITIDYIGREAACAEFGDVRPAELVLARLVADPPPGTTGQRPLPQDSGWLCNGIRTPRLALDQAMRPEPRWRPPVENGAVRHSIFVDVELWNRVAERRQWSCPFLSAVWQLLRLGLLREYGRPVWTPQPWDGDYPERWDQLPPLLAVSPQAAPFAAYRTVSLLDTRFLPVEHAVRTVLGQYAQSETVRDQVAARAYNEAIALPDELVDRVGYAFLPQ